MNNTPFRARVIVADDHHVVRAAISALLSRIAGVEVVGEAADGAELIEQVDRLQPDVVLTDISMPGMNGIEATACLRARHPQVRVLILSMSEQPHVVKRAVASGAHGYLMKGASTIELERAVHGVMAHGEYHSPRIRELLDEYTRSALHETLTARQLEVLTRLARGEAAKEIAFALGLSSKTVDAHRARVMEKLQVSDAASLTLYAVRHGLLDP